MATILYNGRLVLRDNILEQGGVVVEDGKISRVFTAEFTPSPSDQVIDAAGRYISPGFIDAHVHGGGGADTMDATEEAIVQIAETHAKHGMTAFLPTTLTASPEEGCVGKRRPYRRRLQRYETGARSGVQPCYPLFQRDERYPFSRLLLQGRGN